VIVREKNQPTGARGNRPLLESKPNDNGDEMTKPMAKTTGLRRLIGLCVAVVAISAAPAWSQVPAPPQAEPIALVGGTIFPVSGPPIEGGTIVFESGKITAIGTGVALPDGCRSIDVAGRHVYPSLFEAHSEIGLTEIGQVPATQDQRETGRLNPNVKALVAINPDSELIPVTRSNGVLIALSAPAGGLISGKSAIVELDGWTYEQMALRPTATLQMEWPGGRGGGRRRGPPSADESPSEDATLRELHELFRQARAYHAARTADPASQPFDVRLDALGEVLDGRIPIMARADRAAQIQSAVAFAAEENVGLIILGGYDAPLCADLLKEHNVPVIVSAVYRLPLRVDDPYDAAYTLPARLLEAGVRFCISGSDRSETSNARNLAYHAATAVAYGLPADEALKSITLYPAEILGVADRVGSLEVGKDATLIVTTGDPLETASNVELAFIQGRQLDLTDRHKRLYQKYLQKYQQLDAAQTPTADNR